MKRIIAMLMVAALTLVFGLSLTGCDGERPISNQENNSTQQATNETVAKPTEAGTNIGDYSVDIMGCRLSKDYEGDDIVIVKYNFSNIKNDEPTSFMIAIDDTVYQNGVGLNESYFVDDSANYDSGNSTKEIKAGASIEVEVAYELNDTTTDIEVEVKEFFSLFDDTVITKTFSLK